MESKEYKIYSVYKHTFPNNKVYIGMTKRKVEDRWGKNGINYSGQTVFHAIMKYGWINIKHEIIAENLSLEEAKKMEYDKIKEYNADDIKYGYNEAAGGRYIVSKSWYKPVCMYDINGNLLKQFESIAMAELETGITSIWSGVQGKKKIVGGYVWRYAGDSFDKYTIEYNNNSKQVCQYDVMGNLIATYSSILQATKETGSKCISSCCNGKRKMSNRFVWRFIEDDFHKYDDIYNYDSEIAVQYDRKGNYIAEYELNEAKKLFGTAIVACMRGKAPTAYNYVWRYKNDSFFKYHTYNNEKYKMQIYQYNTDGELLNTYKKPDEIKLENVENFHWRNIQRCIRGIRKTAYGYVWKSEEANIE